MYNLKNASYCQKSARSRHRVNEELRWLRKIEEVGGDMGPLWAPTFIAPKIDRGAHAWIFMPSKITQKKKLLKSSNKRPFDVRAKSTLKQKKFYLKSSNKEPFDVWAK